MCRLPCSPLAPEHCTERQRTCGWVPCPVRRDTADEHAHLGRGWFGLRELTRTRVLSGAICGNPRTVTR